MGGPGSGNRWRSSGATCEAYQRIDIVFLRKQGWLQPNRQYRLSWTYGGEPSGNITYWAYASHLLLDYRTREHGEAEWQDVKQTIHFDTTPMNFGGWRRWFRCPRCNRRCRILYGGARYYCRKCYRLQYQTQSETAWQRQLTRAQKIRKRLGGMECVDDPFPPKPKGMHWKTYDRLEAIDERAQDLWNAMVTGFMLRL